MYVFSPPPLITEQFILPSNGRLYDGVTDGNITLRAMTTIEERMRVGGQDFYETMVPIVNECIVNNKNPDDSYKLDSQYFTIFDFDAICIKLKIITYGPEHKIITRCSKCGKIIKKTIDLRDCEFSFLPDDFSEPYDVGPLPRTGDTLGCRFLRVKDRIEMDRESLLIKTKNPEYIGEPSYTLEMNRRIMTINGEDSDIHMTARYVECMTGMDSDYFHRKIDTNFYGVNRIGFAECDGVNEDGTNCDGVGMYAIKADSEFFRCGRDY